MADTIKSSSELKLEAYFQDNDTRVITVDNPKANLTASQINAVGATMKTTNAILGDKGGADVMGFRTAKKTTTTRTELDLR
jgi:hypothetical protein